MLGPGTLEKGGYGLSRAGWEFTVSAANSGFYDPDHLFKPLRLGPHGPILGFNGSGLRVQDLGRTV